MKVIRIQQMLAGVLIFAIALASQALADTSVDSTGNTPSWEKEFVIWPRYEGQPTPWRDDSRISSMSPEGYPNDFPVHFDNPDPAVQDEIMWVTAIDYFAATDEYLGILLNAPNDLRSIKIKDNAVFWYDPDAKQLRALAADGNYAARGLPPRAQSGTPSKLWEGIRQYRLGNFGHNEPAIEQCISILSSATHQLGENASVHDRYLANAVLGRCQAEAYNTEEAIAAFRVALTHGSDDVDVHMALLAEYSLKVHPSAKEAYDATYEQPFLDELGYVLEHYSDDPGVAAITTIIFDESQATHIADMTPEQIARGRKFGFGTFRWKRR